MRGLLARALWPASVLFSGLSALRRGLYRCGVLKAEQVAVPVIVVGNLIAGGAGKTPVVMAIVDLLRRHGYTPGIVSRGYGGRAIGVLAVDRTLTAAESGDEPLLLHLRTGAPLIVGRDRVAAVRHLMRLHPEVDIVVSDDGLQHLRLARIAQVLVFDERGVGNGWLLPAGPLREALPLHVPPRSVVVYNAPSPSTPLPGTLARRSFIGAVGLADWWRGVPASAEVLDDLRGREVVAVAGIARPGRFFAMLRERGLRFTPLPLPDHHAYATLPWPAAERDVIVTEKDAIKLDAARIGDTRVWVAPLDFALDAAFDAALLALLPPPGTPPHGNAPA
ncbi:MAG: tetraacyldisaccharide 4'-kinase [Burkholderiales bacterium]